MGKKQVTVEELIGGLYFCRNPSCCKMFRAFRYKRRGLCVNCYKNDLIRAQFWRVANDIDERERKRNQGLPPTPTTAIPGSEEKIRVLEERHNQGYLLHHPDDVKMLPTRGTVFGIPAADYSVSSDYKGQADHVESEKTSVPEETPSRGIDR